jgi:RNA polymerase sigma factor (sigma-70 family)
VRAGDASALDQLTRCYGERLLAAGRRHCRTEEEAEDAVQDALLIAGAHLDDFRAEGSLQGWLVRIVASACRRLGRGQKNDAARHDADLDSVADPDASPEADSARRELAAHIDQALLALDPEDRWLVLLAEVEDFTAPEIAERTGLSAGAVRTRLTRLRRRLRDGLAAFLAEPDGPANQAAPSSKTR